jgi:glycosyltransferase involved in cell wall biosynthesis
VNQPNPTAPLRVLHVIPSVSPRSGGPSVALPLIVRALKQAGTRVEVATTDDDGPGARLDVPLNQPVENEGTRYFYFRRQTEFYKYSRPFHRWLSRCASNYDLIHVHGLFSYTSVCASRIAKRRAVPYIVRPLGVLNRWGMENRRPWLKRLSFHFIEKPILRHAAAMHYTSQQECQEAEAAGATAPAFVCPLGLDLAPFQNLPGPDLFLKRWPKAADRDVVLFLSRLDQKKGLDLLLDAFEQARPGHPRAILVIAGSGESAFVKGLRERVEKLGLNNDVIWTSFLDGLDKLSALAAAKVFALTSYSENFGIAVAEALAAGVPTLITKEVGVADDVQRAGAGMVVSAEAGAVAERLTRMLKDSELIKRMSINARKLAAERYSLDAMGIALIQLYRQIQVAYHGNP